MRETHQIGARTRELLVHHRICAPLGQNQIMLVGRSDAAEGFKFVRPNWPNSQVMVCFRGEGQVWAQGRWQTLSHGQAYLTPPRSFSAYHTIKGKRWGLVWVTYEPAMYFSPVSCAAATVRKADPRPLKVAIEGLHREMTGKSDAACVQGWVDLIQLYAARIGDQGHHDRFWSIWEQVANHLQYPWSIDELAALATMSGEHFRRLCHRQRARTPMGHLTYLRMHRAATLLVSTRHKIEAVAEMIGYSNRFSFSNAFRREMGKTPAVYRKLYGSP